MEHAVFAERLAIAARRAVEFARTFVEETLPDAIRFRVRLNSSYDGNPLHVDERVYPDDHHAHSIDELAQMVEAALVDLLWRDGAVPEWIDFSVKATDDDATIVEAMCCGRFTANDAILYHEREGIPPFHVVGPALPPGWKRENPPRFSLYWSTSIERRVELRQLSGRSEKVQNLTLQGPWCDDETLASLAGMKRLMTLRLEGTSVRGSGLVEFGKRGVLGLGGVPLQYLTFSGVASHVLQLDGLSNFPTLKSLWIDGVPTGLEGLGALGDLDRVDWLHLNVPPLRDIAVVARMPAVETLNLNGTQVSSLAPMSHMKRLKHLSLKGTQVADSELHHLLAVPHLRTLELGETAVTDEGVRQLAGIPTLWRLWINNTAVTDATLVTFSKATLLDKLDVRGTRVTLEGVAQLAASLPDLQIVADGWKKLPKRMWWGSKEEEQEDSTE